MEQDARSKKIFEEVQNELKDLFKQAEATANQFRDKYFGVLGKVDALMRNKCKSQIDWLEAITEQTQQGPKLKDKSKAQELERTVNDLQNCVQKNDVGSQPLLVEFDDHMQQMSDKFNSGFGSCLKLQGDNDVKSCFKKLLQENLSDLGRFYETFGNKFDALNNKL